MCPPPLVGRDKQRHQLRTAARPGALVLLTGAAGTGKTRLVHELDPGPDLPVLTGHCPPRTPPFPLAPVVEALRTATLPEHLTPLCGALHPLLPEHASHLPPPPPPATTPAAQDHRLHRALAELLDALGPALLVLEDLHWADPHTRDLLTYLTPRLPPHLGLVLTYRPEELPADFPVAALATRTPPTTSHHHLTLPPLTPEHLRALAHHILAPTTLTDTQIHHLHTWTAGLPLAAVETLHHLTAAPGPLPTEEPPVPPTLRDWLLERLHRLDRDTRRLVRAAAVLNHPSTETDLARVADLTIPRADKALSRALRLGLLRTASPAALAPATPLLARVCHDALPHGTRRRLHRAALAALAQDPDPPHARLAHHARECARLREWTDHAEHAADQALAQGEDTTAVTLLRDALTRPDLPARRRADLALKLGRAALTGISAEHTITLLRDVLAAPGLTTPERGQLRMELGLLLLNQAAQGRTARGELVRAAAELATRPGLAARAMCALAVPRSTPDAVDTHRRWIDQAVAAARRSQDEAVGHSVAVNRATLLAQIGDPAAWEADLPDPGAAHPHPTPRILARRREFARASLNLADAAVMLGHYDRADHHLAQTTRWYPAAEAPYFHESAQALRLMLDWARGHWAALAQETERHLDAPHLAHLHSVTAELTLVRAALALAQGEAATAHTHLSRFTPRPPDQPPGPDYTVPVRAFAAGLLARLALARDDADQAWSHVEELVSLVASKGIWVWATDLVPGVGALPRTGRGDLAQDLCTRMRAGLRGTSAPAADAALLRLEATLAHHRGDHTRALDLYTDARDVYQAMPRPYDAAQVREEAARTRLSQGGGRHREQGVAALRAALEEYTLIGAAWDAARVRRTLRAHGVPAAPAAPARRDGRLSPREGEIAALAAQGHTNRQIADLLHLSPRTVETHVANALAKLGLHSRRDLSAPHTPAPT
ncbi:LuxR family transcriptional regulator [Nocardiopsis sp. FR26]|uniref:helix-turn-helix transcriptional regulator n=1 Tax=Nocardiopsis sp. FR26 TaxID=2605987 RepID=UPI001359EBD4|nr:LuxR family transcriptional regulator [Nocardiopsis sp. FR26]